MKKILVFSLIFICISSILHAAQSNLFDFNGDYSHDQTGSEKVPSKWMFPLSATIKLKITEEVPPESGLKKSLMVDYSKAAVSDYSRYFLSDFIPVNPAIPHIQKVWLKTEGKTAKGFGITFGRMFYDKNKKLITYNGYLSKRIFTNNIGPKDWTLISSNLVPQRNKDSIEKDEIPSNAAYVRIMFLSYSYNKKYWVTGHVFKPCVPGDKQNSRDAAIIKVPAAEQFETPQIDGFLNDPVWKNTKNVNTNFVRTVCDRKLSVPVKSQTSFYTFQKNNNFFFAFECKSAHPNHIKAEKRPVNDKMIFGDEAVELFIDATGKREKIVQIGLNAAGSYAVLFNYVPIGLPLKYSVRRTQDGWTGELAIPREKLWQIYNEAGCELNPDVWNINVCRHQPAAVRAERYSSWKATGEAFSSPHDMGILLFSDTGKVLQKVFENSEKEIAALFKKNPLPERTESVSLNRTLTEIRSITAIPSWIISQLTDNKKVSENAFAEYYSEAVAFTSVVKAQIKNFQRLNFAFPQERSKYGCLLAAVPLLDPVSHENLPDPANISSKLSVRGAGDETAFARFRIFAGQNLKNVKITWTSFKDNKGNIIPDSNIDVRILHPWGKNHQADILATDLRIPFKGYLKKYAEAERFIPEISSNTSRDIIVCTRISPQQKPGFYTGKITIAPETNPASELDMTVEVLPFNLQQTKKYVGFFSHMVLFDPKSPAIGTPGAVFYNGRENEKSFTASVRLLTDLGFNFLIQPVYRNGAFNPQYTEKILKLCFDGGLKRIALTGAEHFITPVLFTQKNADLLNQKKELLTQRLSNTVKTAHKLGFKECYFYGSDEPHTQVDIQRNDTIFAAAKKAGGSTVVACILESVRSKLKDMDAVAMNYLSMTTSTNPLLDNPPAGLKRLYYANMNNNFNQINRMAFGWYLEKSGFDGNIPWALYYLGAEWEPFKDFAVSGQLSLLNAAYVFPTADKPVPTLKFIAAAAGVADLRYIETLKDMIKNSSNTIASKKAEAELKKMLDVFDIYNPQGNQSKNYKIPPLQYDIMRDRLQNLILSLQ